MSWTQREKETLVHLLQHPGWTITSISKEIGTKDVIEVGLSVEALRAKAPQLVAQRETLETEIYKECPGCETVPDSTLTKDEEEQQLSLFNIPGLLRLAHDLYMKDPNTGIERSSLLLLYSELRSWLSRMVIASDTLARERRKHAERAHRNGQRRKSQALEISRRDVWNAVRLLQPDCLPPKDLSGVTEDRHEEEDEDLQSDEAEA